MNKFYIIILFLVYCIFTIKIILNILNLKDVLKYDLYYKRI